MSPKLGGFMVRWLIEDIEQHHLMNRNIHPYFINMIQLKKKGLDYDFWFGISHESFKCFLSRANVSLENLNSIELSGIIKDLSKKEIPNELKNEIVRALSSQKLMDSKFELELLIHINGDTSFQLPWSQICSISTKSVEGIYQSIKACWLTIFRASLTNHFSVSGVDINKIQMSILIKRSQEVLMQGKAFSYSPRCPWDRRNSVVSYEKGRESFSFLVDRVTFKSMYYGRNLDGLDESSKTNFSSGIVKEKVPQNNFAFDKVRKIAEYLQNCEKLLDNALEIEWTISKDQRIHLNRIKYFDRSPSAQQLAPQFNTTTRNIWDQSIIQWNASSLIKPLWFSLLPRNFRILSINYIRDLGVKNKITPDFEKVFRSFWGVLRGRLYINLGALHSFLGLSESHDLAEEIDLNVSLWLKRYDRESRDAWNSQWPQLPSYSSRDKKIIFKNINQILKNWPEKISNWINLMHGLRESIVSTQWKDKNVSTMINSLQDWEKKYIPSMVPILVAEIQYRNLLSWYYEGAQKPSYNKTLEPSWLQLFELGGQEIMVTTDDSWFTKRKKLKLLKQIETLNQMRPKYISMLDDVYIKLRRFLELMGQKYQSIGLIDKSDDFFYLTLEEILAFEEGRATTISWSNIVAIRKEEYRRYSNDLKTPETWFTTGLVGLAAQFPEVISIREKKMEIQNSSLHPLQTKLKEKGFDPLLFSKSTANIEFTIQNDEKMKEDKFILATNETQQSIVQLDFVEDNSSEKKMEISDQWIDNK